MTDIPNEDAPSVDTTTLDESREVEVDASTYGQRIVLTTHTLGFEPYVLIRAVKGEPDPDDSDDDGIRLKIEHNDDGPQLALLYVLNLPAEQNPLTAAIKAVIDANYEHPDGAIIAEALAMFAEFCDIPMPESGR